MGESPLWIKHALACSLEAGSISVASAEMHNVGVTPWGPAGRFSCHGTGSHVGGCMLALFPRGRWSIAAHEHAPSAIILVKLSGGS